MRVLTCVVAVIAAIAACGKAAAPKPTAAVKAEVTAEDGIRDPELRRDLLALYEEDQAARAAWVANRDDAAAKAAVVASDLASTARLKRAVEQSGWPGNSMVGQDGAQAAWLLVQHADRDLAFQKRCLALMEPMVKSGEVAPEHHAYLYDRVAVAEQRPQRYGTQFDGSEPAPIEDEANVDARRRAVGLGTMAEYRQQMLEAYGPAK